MKAIYHSTSTSFFITDQHFFVKAENPFCSLLFYFYVHTLPFANHYHQHRLLRFVWLNFVFVSVNTTTTPITSIVTLMTRAYLEIIIFLLKSSWAWDHSIFFIMPTFNIRLFMHIHIFFLAKKIMSWDADFLRFFIALSQNKTAYLARVTRNMLLSILFSLRGKQESIFCLKYTLYII